VATTRTIALSLVAFACFHTCALGIRFATAADPDPYYHASGPLAGSLTTDRLPIYDADPDHLWNRLFCAFYVRESNLPAAPGGPPVRRLEGGDWIDFFGWSGTTYWSEPATCQRINALLDEFLATHGERLIDDPLKRTIMLRDLWAAYDFFVGQNILRFGTPEDLQRRDEVARKLAEIVAALAPTADQIAALPDNYTAAVASGRFAADHANDPRIDYLPPGLLADPQEWIEMDFYQPDLHEDLSGRFITLHTRSYRGRSYFRIFYRWPGGRDELAAYLRYLDDEGIDWRRAAQLGFIQLKPDVRQFPAGTQVALVQFMMTLDQTLRPTPTPIVESLRLRTFPDPAGGESTPTNTGLGMNVYEYTLKRRLLFDDLSHGGLAREPDEQPQYRVIMQPRRDGADWGAEGRTQTLRQQCLACHTGDGVGVRSLPSIVNMGGFDAGAQLGVAISLAADQPSPRGTRAAKWKTEDETYRRLLEHLGR
jgi:hypothetical protein